MRITNPIFVSLMLAALAGSGLTRDAVADDAVTDRVSDRSTPRPKSEFGILPQVRQYLQKNGVKRSDGSKNQQRDSNRNRVEQAAYPPEAPWPVEPESSSDFAVQADDLIATEGCAENINTESWFHRAPTSLVWTDFNYLVWGTKAMTAPALATTSPDGTMADVAGVLGEPGTSILFGNSSLSEEARSGGRFTLGAWLNDCRRNGIEVTYLFVGEQTDGFMASQDDLTILARPFFNVDTDMEDARLVAFPSLVEGTLQISSESDFQTLTLLNRHALVRSPYGIIDCVAGYRFGKLDDNITIRESTLSLGGPTAGTMFDLFDAFDTENTFHGGEVGIEMKQQINCLWSCDMSAKFAVGGTWLDATVSGQTDTTVSGTTTTTPGGLLTQPTNLGQFDDSNISTVSEFGVTLRRHFGKRSSFVIGYNYIFWSNVLRAGDQIDLSVNPTQIPPGMLAGEARPAFPFATTDFWAHGLRLGWETSY